MKYYELIGFHTGEVIGVCPEDSLLHAIQEDHLAHVGEITRDQFRRFGDHPWTKPKGKLFRADLVESVKLTPI